MDSDQKIFDDKAISEVMPLDLALLYNTSNFLSFHHPNYDQVDGDDDDENGDNGGSGNNSNNKSNNNNRYGHGRNVRSSRSPEPFGCRRAASFPTFSLHKHSLARTTTFSKRRCSSESNIKNDSLNVLNGLTLVDLKKQVAALVISGMKKSYAKNSATDDEDNVSFDLGRKSGSETSFSGDQGLAGDRPPPKPKKKVSFADDNGRTLASIRIMAEPSDVPPILTSPVALAIILAHDPDMVPTFCLSPPVNGPLSAFPSASAEAHGQYHWQLDFAQPASDYLKFRNKLDKNNVALENVILKNDVGTLVGTVKVKNLSFDKTVFVRHTDDRWATRKDEPCSFVQPVRHKTNHPDLVDTFRFDFPIPVDNAQRALLELCLCYRLPDGREFWDSNDDGSNYRISSALFGQSPPPLPPNATDNGSSSAKLLQRKSRSDSSLMGRIVDSDETDEQDDGVVADDSVLSLSGRRNSLQSLSVASPMTTSTTTRRRKPLQRRLSSDAFELQFENWAEFSTWKHLDTQGPYW